MKKKGIIAVIVLFVLALVGFGGYKVYSYYWTQGEFSGGTSTGTNGEIILEKVFNPMVNTNPDVNENDDLWNDSSYSINLECAAANSNGITHCTGGTTFINGSTDAMDVVVSDATYRVGSEWNSEDEELDLSAFNWTSITVPAGESRQLVISADFSMLTSEEKNEPQEVSDPVTGVYREVSVAFKLTASNHVE